MSTISPAPRLAPPPDVPRIVDEGADYLVIDKPAHLMVHPSKPEHTFTLWHELIQLLSYELVCGGQISLVNRLDRETSGLVLVAKTREAASRLHRQMQGRYVAKEYLALVWGWPVADTWRCEAPLLRRGEKLPTAIYLQQMVHPEGATACTEFRVERRFGGPDPARRFSLVRATLFTGRTHQIRVHLAHAGFPIVGDKIYGPDERCYLEFIETGWTPALAQRLLLPRQALHSAYLALPQLGHVWQSALPADLAAFIETS